ncbi:MAG TPA: N-acetyltransferase [Blastocatellia bacterium]|nr:N-acetyltransferase [Blastocatellia bacterium]
MHTISRSKQSTGDLELRPVRTRLERSRFVGLPYRLHRENPHWIPPLRIAQKDILNTRRHPFYKTADAELFLAFREGRLCGRIMAIINRAYNEFHNERAGFFGFFEVENDAAAAKALLETACDWVRSRGAEVIRGPVNPSTNYECGLLIEGFDLDPTVMMPYNPPYYADLIEGCGFRKAMDLYAYDIAANYFIVSDKLKRVAERLRTKDKIKVRTVDMKDFKREVEIVRQVYNDAWSNNWGFVPVSEAEFKHLAKDLKQLVDPRVVMIAERETEGSAEPRPVGFFLAVPDLNRALKKINGRLLPFGLIKLLWHSRKIDSIRIITMGVVSEYQSMGLGAVLLDEIYRRGPAAGFPNGEMSWVLENNLMMNRAAQLIGGRRTKTYRIYEMQLNQVSRF